MKMTMTHLWAKEGEAPFCWRLLLNWPNSPSPSFHQLQIKVSSVKHKSWAATLLAPKELYTWWWPITTKTKRRVQSLMTHGDTRNKIASLEDVLAQNCCPPPQACRVDNWDASASKNLRLTGLTDESPPQGKIVSLGSASVKPLKPLPNKAKVVFIWMIGNIWYLYDGNIRFIPPCQNRLT